MKKKLKRLLTGMLTLATVFTALPASTVYVDADGNMIITKNPTLAPSHQKSSYKPKVQEADGTVDVETMQDATAFLETFFKLYPTATEKELAYYVAGNVLEPINGDYLYSELINPIFTQDGENVKVSVSVKFIDNQTKATQISQFELVLYAYYKAIHYFLKAIT